MEHRRMIAAAESITNLWQAVIGQFLGERHRYLPRTRNRPAIEEGLSRREVFARPRERPAAADRDDPVGAVHGRTRQPGDARSIQEVSRRRRLCPRADVVA